MPVWLVTWAAGVWSKVQVYVAIAAGVIVAFWVTYWRGRRDAQRDSRLEGMRDNERAQRQANEVQRDVASRSDADVAGGLRRWNRD